MVSRSDLLRDIILDFREADLPTGVPRRIDVTQAPGKATVCIGPRRAGKSTFLFQQLHRRRPGVALPPRRRVMPLVSGAQRRR